MSGAAPAPMTATTAESVAISVWIRCSWNRQLPGGVSADPAGAGVDRDPERIDVDHGGAAQEPLGQVDESAFRLDAGAQLGGRIEGSLDAFAPVHGQGVPGDVERHHQQ